MVIWLPETFTNYFSKYEDILDFVIMINRHLGRPQGFGFITFVNFVIVEKVLEEDYVIDGRMVMFAFPFPYYVAFPNPFISHFFSNIFFHDKAFFHHTD